MNTVIANHYGEVRAEITASGFELVVDAETPRKQSVHLPISLHSANQLVYLLAILRAVQCRMNHCQIRNSKPPEAAVKSQDYSEFPGSEDLDPQDISKNKVYGRFPNFLIYEQFEQDRLRMFFSVRDDEKHIARFDLNSGQVEAFRMLVERALLSVPEVDLSLRDEISLAVACRASAKGLVFDVQTPHWQSHFLIGKAHNVAALGVFLGRALNGAKAAPIRFNTDVAGLAFRTRSDGRVVTEFHFRDSREELRLSSLELRELEVLTRYVVYRSFESQNGNSQPRVEEPTLSLN